MQTILLLQRKNKEKKKKKTEEKKWRETQTLQLGVSPLIIWSTVFTL